jgi:Na+/H+ antiporter NhaD/arsenite permease-like protein
MLTDLSVVSPFLLASAEHTVPDPNVFFITPFALLLLSIALVPFINGDWWGKHYAKVSVGLGLVVVAYYVFGLNSFHRVVDTMIDYASFLSLIGSLFVVAGGIHITVKGESKPWTNVLFLGIGAVVANLVGTTGASMLLVRPWIRMNKFRYTALHTIFFIFVVSNCGGCLTPIGDPPLFLGYLKHVPFFWVMKELWLPWIFVIALLLTVFFIYDTIDYARVPKDIAEKETSNENWRFDGLHNFLFLGLILWAVFLPAPYRELTMIAAGALSYFFTSKQTHESNHFTFHPILEVGWLFFGIFLTMIPALDFLSLHAASLGISHPIQFYFVSGALSSVLDNAPTYLTFLTAAVSQHINPVTLQSLNIDSASDMALFLTLGKPELIAISLGSVCFGAMTYIGNGPNLMVKAVIDHAKCRTPNFLEYIYKYSLLILLPILIVTGYLFLVILK